VGAAVAWLGGGVSSLGWLVPPQPERRKVKQSNRSAEVQIRSLRVAMGPNEL